MKTGHARGHEDDLQIREILKLAQSGGCSDGEALCVAF